MDWTKIRREGDRHRSEIPVSNWHHILVWEVSTIAIPGRTLLERCEWSFGDVQPICTITGEVVDTWHAAVNELFYWSFHL
jgi:hypothetical protein